MKAYFVCELDVGDFSDIIHGCYRTWQEAEAEVKKTEDNPNCEVPLYVMQANVESFPPTESREALKLEPIPQ